MPTPEVLPEIWTNVFRFVKRNTPPPYRTALWKDLHQHDLTVVSRVNSAFHELALPYLYTSVIVNDLPLFLDPAPNGGLGGKVTSKKGRLRMVKHLRVTALGPPQIPRWSITSLLQTGNWDLIDETEIQRTMRFAKEGFQELGPLIDCLQAKSKAKHLTHIETVVIGQRGACGWEKTLQVAMDDRNSGLLKHMNQATELFTRFVKACQPKYICLHTFYGPYFFRSFNPSDDSAVVAFTSHQLDGFGFLNYVGGAQNRHIIEPGSRRTYDGTLYGQTEVPDMHELHYGLHNLMKMEKLKVLDRKLSFEVYGFFDPLIHEDFEANSPNGPDIRARRQAEERRARHLHKDSHFDDLPQIWPARISLEPAEQSPCCLACGWTFQVGWHD